MSLWHSGGALTFLSQCLGVRYLPLKVALVSIYTTMHFNPLKYFTSPTLKHFNRCLSHLNTSTHMSSLLKRFIPHVFLTSAVKHMTSSLKHFSLTCLTHYNTSATCLPHLNMSLPHCKLQPRSTSFKRFTSHAFLTTTLQPHVFLT